MNATLPQTDSDHRAEARETVLVEKERRTVDSASEDWCVARRNRVCACCACVRARMCMCAHAQYVVSGSHKHWELGTTVFKCSVVL